jgi:hypothetical protein
MNWSIAVLVLGRKWSTLRVGPKAKRCGSKLRRGDALVIGDAGSLLAMEVLPMG